MIFHTQQIKGQGRGHTIGFPTINLKVPAGLVLDPGIYAVWVVIHGTTYKGALHYGEIPTFHQKEMTMEVHLLDITDETAPDTTDSVIEIDTVEYLRSVQNFHDTDDLIVQMSRDVERVKIIFS